VVTPDGFLQDTIVMLGNREIVLTTSADVGQWETPSFSLRHEDGWPGWLATIRLASTFYIDLSPDNIFFASADPEELIRNNMVKWSDKAGGRPIRGTDVAAD
jgi:hypothetical protein